MIQLPHEAESVMLNVSSGVGINSVIWITSLDPSEMGTTNRVHDDVQPYFVNIGLPFHAIEPRSRKEFLAALAGIAKRASEGLRPIIHLDAHGSLENGLRIAGPGDYVSWSELVDHFRPINVATQNNLCVVSAVCFGLHAIKPVTIDKPARQSCSGTLQHIAQCQKRCCPCCARSNIDERSVGLSESYD
jgi:hypothetical protein